jgi:two-component system, OmpR family, sensor histidine kinase KdpD
LDNAGKYAPSGTPIEVSAELVDLEGKREVRVSVSDRGPGVPERDRSQVFDKFHRLPGSGSRQGGTGLGLAIVKGLVEAHGGHVWIEAGEEGGARFVFSLPTLDQEVVTEQQVEEEAAP